MEKATALHKLPFDDLAGQCRLNGDGRWLSGVQLPADRNAMVLTSLSPP